MVNVTIQWSPNIPYTSIYIPSWYINGITNFPARYHTWIRHGYEVNLALTGAPLSSSKPGRAPQQRPATLSARRCRDASGIRLPWGRGDFWGIPKSNNTVYQKLKSNNQVFGCFLVISNHLAIGIVEWVLETNLRQLELA